MVSICPEKKQTDSAYKKTCNGAQKKSGMDRFFCPFLISGSQLMGYTDVNAGTHADQYTRKQGDQQCCGTDGTQSHVICKTSHDRNIA